MDELYIWIGNYQKQGVYFGVNSNNVMIEKDHTYLVQPTTEERKGLIDTGLIKIVNKILSEGKE